MEAQRPGERCHVVVVGRDRAAVAEAAEVLGGEERERGGVAERTGPSAVEAGPGRLRGILQDGQSKRADVGRGSGIAEQVDGDDRRRGGGESAPDRLRR